VFNLFGKIFLWFWGTMLVTAAAVAFTTAQLGGAKIPPMIERAHVQFVEAATEATGVLASGGVRALGRWRDEHGTRSMRLYVFDPAGTEAFGQTVPAELRRFSRRFAGDPTPGPMRERRGMIVHAVPVPGEGLYRLVMIFQPPHPVWHLFTFPGLLVALLLSAVVCFGLARYLTSPLLRLRGVVQALAGGDLSVRVGPALTRRGDEIGSLGRDFDRMAERLQELIESQQRLLRDVSHELRSPLARLQAALGLARQRTGEQAADELERIEREAERLEELIGQTLSLTRLASGVESRREETVDLAGLLRSVADDARFEAAQGGRTVTEQLEDFLLVRGDPELLHRAIENVVRNAVRYTSVGGAVELSLRRVDAQALISVRDYGAGVDRRDLERLFDPFFRSGEARDRASGGYGLGLAIARRAVELHGGDIRACNAPGGGLQVDIRLPLSPADSRSGQDEGE
jgi:two-component system sensor histidine kinase CpxA